MKHVPHLADNARVTGKDFNRLIDLILRCRVYCVGPGMCMASNSAGTYIGLTASPFDAIHGALQPGPGNDTMESFWARIIGTASLGSNQWAYSFEPVHKNGAAYETGSWVTSTGWEPDTAYGYNTLEYMNSSAGVQGNGVDITGTDFPATMGLQPCPVGAIVRMYAVYVPSLDQTEYWFSYPNGIDGTCS